MEEFLKQAKEFNYSFWGGLFFFVGGLLMTVTLPFIHIQKRGLWYSILSILGLFPGIYFSVRLFLYQHTLLGSLLAVIALIALIIVAGIEIRKRIQISKP
ncbi:MAG: hypothetical protein QXS96_08575 [Candidatus Caldarchaeum sp.]